MKTLKQKLIALLILGFQDAVIAESTSAITSYTYYNEQFHTDLVCQNLNLKTAPYFVLNTPLSNTNNHLRQGSFVDFNKKKVIRSWNLIGEVPLNTILPDNFLDDPSLWQIKVLTTKNEDPAIDLTNKTLEIYKNEDHYFAQRCCTGNSCQILPVYKVLENKKWVANLAFSLKKSDFLKSYSLIKGAATLSQPKEFIPKMPAIDASLESSFVRPYFSESSGPGTSFPEPESTKGLQQNVVCTKSDPLKIYDDTLKNVIYRIQRFQSIKVFQNWNGEKEEVMLGKIRMYKVQASSAKGTVINGWAAANLIKTPADCSGYTLIGSPSGETLIQGSTIVVNNHPGLYRFPTEEKPMYNYTKGSGERYFGAGRSGRKHAACDLFRPKGEKVFAIAHGVVLNKYLFYSGTYAIEVKHDTGQVVRYGEVASRSVAGAKVGDRIVKGQHIGYIDHLKMLHFEMYKGTSKGPLTVRGRGSFDRRADLMDPTALLKNWEQETF